MTALGPVRPVSADSPRPFPSWAAPDRRSTPIRTMGAWWWRLRARSGFSLATHRPLDAGGLTDRQLADIGLVRFDLPDGRGWRQ